MAEEQVLQHILDVLKENTQRLSSLEKGQTSLQAGFSSLEKGQANLETGMSSLEKRQASLEKGQANLASQFIQLGLEFEDQRKDIRIVAEGHSILNRKLDEHTVILNNINEHLEKLDLQVLAHDNKLRLIK